MVIRLLMFLYVVLVTSEGQPVKRRWWRKRKPINSLLTFAESGVESLPVPQRSGRTIPKPKHEALDWTPTPRSEPQHKAVVEVIPESLVEVERMTAVRLQMPNRTTPQGIRAYGNARFDTPIGRTLTREFMRRDVNHVPRAALRHLPIMDAAREVYAAQNGGPHPTSPRRAAEARKGRPTPKRGRRG